jgi:hypothetical protein
MRPAVFLDRDGTIVEDVGYLDRIEHRREACSCEPGVGPAKRVSRRHRGCAPTRSSRTSQKR